MGARRTDGLWRAVAAAALLVASVAFSGEEAPAEDYECARSLFETCILAGDAEPHERLEALEHVARAVNRAAIAQEILPLYLKAVRSTDVTDENVAMALAEGFAMCLVKQRQPYAEVRDVLRYEAKGRQDSAVGAALLAMAERLNRLCDSETSSRRAVPGEGIDVPQVARAVPHAQLAVKLPQAPASAPKPAGIAAPEPLPRHLERVVPAAGGPSSAPAKPLAPIDLAGTAARPAGKELAGPTDTVAVPRGLEVPEAKPSMPRVQIPGEPPRTPAAAPKPAGLTVPEPPPGQVERTPPTIGQPASGQTRPPAPIDPTTSAARPAGKELPGPDGTVAAARSRPDDLGRMQAARPAPSERIRVDDKRALAVAEIEAYVTGVQLPEARSITVGVAPATVPKSVGGAPQIGGTQVARPRVAELPLPGTTMKAVPAPAVDTREIVRPRAEPLPVSGAARLPATKPITPDMAAEGTAPAIRKAIGTAVSAELGKMVAELAKEADWKAKQGDHDGALGLFGAVIRDAPETAFSEDAVRRSLPIALARPSAKDQEAALRSFEAWVEKLGGPRDQAFASLLILQQRYRENQFARAQEGLKAFLARHKDAEFIPQAQLLLALATWRVGDRDDAVKLLREIVRSHPNDPAAPRAQFLMGYLFFAAGEQEPAHAAFLRVINDYPDSPFAEKAIEFLGAEAANRAEAEAERLQAQELPSATCLRTELPVRIDGHLGDAAWNAAPAVRLAYRGKGEEPAPQPDPNAAFRLLWDDTALYIAFECRDEDIRSEARNRDDPVLLGDALRVLVAPVDGRAQGQPTFCFDFAVAPTGALNDGKAVLERGMVLWQHARNAAAWNCLGIQCAARMDGTLNDAKPDRGWAAELAVPFDALGFRPSEGSVWRMNFQWVNRQADGERAVASWSPPGAWLPQPRLFGRVTFSAAPKQ